MKISIALSCTLTILFMMGLLLIPQTGSSQKKLSFSFHHRVGNETLVLDNSYTNILGENIVVRKFKYYLSNFSITDQSGKTHLLPADYFLVDEADSASKIIALNVPTLEIKSINFLLGVDSIRNVSGIQTGVLDPLQGMFWTWNSGYIMAKLEGTSDSSHIAGQAFTYHIGGFKGETNTNRYITLTLPQKNKPQNNIHITADINHWFKSKSEIRIAQTPVCHTPGALAVKIADNYSTMFSVNSDH